MTMKMIVAVPFALITLGVLGCSQQASTAPAVQHPAPAAAASDTNMFGESKEAAAGNPADARAAAYADPQPAAGANGAGADQTAPK
jgi:hypothetical protein